MSFQSRNCLDASKRNGLPEAAWGRIWYRRYLYRGQANIGFGQESQALWLTEGYEVLQHKHLEPYEESPELNCDLCQFPELNDLGVQLAISHVEPVDRKQKHNILLSLMELSSQRSSTLSA